LSVLKKKQTFLRSLQLFLLHMLKHIRQN
jgi:hypothetical protein